MRGRGPPVLPGELDVLAARLIVYGADVAWDDGIPGVRRFFTADPWRNRIEMLNGR